MTSITSVAHCLAQPWVLGGNYKSSHGYFPTEESFSERLIPALVKLGISWSVMGDNHFSHTLTDYPYATYDMSLDAMISPPNRADLRNTSNIGAWSSEPVGACHHVRVEKNLSSGYRYILVDRSVMNGRTATSPR